MNELAHRPLPADFEISTDGLSTMGPGLSRDLARVLRRGVRNLVIHVTRPDSHWLASALRAVQLCETGSRYVDSMADVDDLRELREELETSGVSGVVVLADVAKMSPPVLGEVARLQNHPQVRAIIELRSV